MKTEDRIVKLDDDRYYISADSTYADDRTQVLNAIHTFGIFDRWGDIHPLGQGVYGIYYQGTRFVSRLELRMSGHRPLLLSSSIKEENEILSVDLTNPDMFTGDELDIKKGTLHLLRRQFVREGAFYEQILVENYGDAPETIEFSLCIAADFADIFEVRGIQRKRRGEVFPMEVLSDNKLKLKYVGLDNVVRGTQIDFTHPFQKKGDHTIHFSIPLEPKKKQMFKYAVHFLVGTEESKGLDHDTALSLIEPELQRDKELFAEIVTSNEQFNHWITRSRADLIALTAETKHGRYPFAGVPWYNTAFGRDGIITAMQTLWAAPLLSRDVLLFLAANQATEEDAYTDAEPGKILHETRGGEMVELNEIPFKKYYGGVDSTPLFIMLAGYYFKRSGDIETIKSIWPNIKAANDWIDNYGDIDGDGFIEYAHKSEQGLTNQGWKDSFDSVFREDGQLAEDPIALCEVQGYVYEAKKQLAWIAERLRETQLASKSKKQASQLKKKFNRTFWDEKMKTFVLALEGKNNPCLVMSSNAGQCLFTGIADHDKADKLAQRLFEPDMYSGWGIRTISEYEKRYNPMSYHNGSIWPHDVGIIAYGLSRYGHTKKATDLMTSLFEASLYIDLQRLPELFCGFPRRKGEGPTAYPVACSPQAWAVGSVYMMLNCLLRMEIIHEEKKVIFNKPTLPEYLEKIRIANLLVGDSSFELEVIRYDGDQNVGVNIKKKSEGWEVLVRK